MVIGFDRFREAFQDFAENYIVIGGSACDWLFTSRNAQFRATKDIDLVVVAERMSPAFAAMIAMRRRLYSALFPMPSPKSGSTASDLRFFPGCTASLRIFIGWTCAERGPRPLCSATNFQNVKTPRQPRPNGLTSRWKRRLSKRRPRSCPNRFAKSSCSATSRT